MESSNEWIVGKNGRPIKRGGRTHRKILKKQKNETMNVESVSNTKLPPTTETKSKENDADTRMEHASKKFNLNVNKTLTSQKLQPAKALHTS